MTGRVELPGPVAGRADEEELAAVAVALRALAARHPTWRSPTSWADRRRAAWSADRSGRRGRPA